MLSLLPMATAQTTACYLIAVILGLPVTVNIVYTILAVLPISVFYISLGLLCGSIFTSKQVGGICGALLTNVSAWLSGVWFDLTLLGKTFGEIANLLPFIHAVELERAMVNGNFSHALPHLWPVLAYGITITVCAILLFLRQTKRQ